jgi:hypothetical protein
MNCAGSAILRSELDRVPENQMPWVEAAVAFAAGDTAAAGAVKFVAAGRTGADELCGRRADFVAITSLAVAANRKGRLLPLWTVPCSNTNQRVCDFVQNRVAHCRGAIELSQLRGKRDSSPPLVAAAESRDRAIEGEAPSSQSVRFHQIHRQSLRVSQRHRKLLSRFRRAAPSRLQRSAAFIAAELSPDREMVGNVQGLLHC